MVCGAGNLLFLQTQRTADPPKRNAKYARSAVHRGAPRDDSTKRVPVSPKCALQQSQKRYGTRSRGSRILAQFVTLLVFAVIALGSMRAQNKIPSGTNEGEFFIAGGHSVAGGRSDTGVFQAGFRLGRVLFQAPKGNLEYSIDFIPIYYIVQRQNAYGISFTPFNLKYNFTSFHRAIPYLELGGGILFTTHDVPDGTNAVNFTPQAGIGLHIPMNSGSNRYFGVALKYIHVSNAGLSVPNPGLNTLQVKLSIVHFGRKVF